MGVTSPEIIYEGKRVILLKKPIGWYGSSYDQNVILGKIPYNFKSDKKLSKNAVIKFNIGELQPTASRENLDYNNTTTSNYELVLKEAREEINDYIKQQSQNGSLKDFLLTCDSLDANGEFKGYSFENFKNILLTNYFTRSYYKRTHMSSTSFNCKVLDNLYYYDNPDIREQNIKDWVKDNRDILVIPKHNVGGIAHLLKEVAIPLSSIITAQAIVKQSKKGLITYTDIFNNKARTATLDEFEKKYLSSNKPIVYAIESRDYLSRYDCGIIDDFHHLRLTPTELRKIGIRKNIFNVIDKKAWVGYLIKTNPVYLNSFIRSHYSNFFEKYKFNPSSSFVKFLHNISRTSTMSKRFREVIDIEDFPEIQKKLKTLRIVINSLNKRELNKKKYILK